MYLAESGSPRYGRNTMRFALVYWPIIIAVLRLASNMAGFLSVAALHDVAPLLMALDIMDTYWSVGTRTNQVISVVQCLQHSANGLGLELAHLHDNIGYGCTERGLERCVA
jgi:hypothetical protein